METAPKTAHIENLGDTLALTQHTFGYLPQDSLILIGLADGQARGHLRVDLEPLSTYPGAQAHKLADWMLTDTAKAPQALAVVIADQNQLLTEEETEAISSALGTVFNDRNVFIAAEHRLTDHQHYLLSLEEALEKLPQLAVTTVDPLTEARAWLSRPAEAIIYPDNHSLDVLLQDLVALVIQAEQPDWPTIDELEASIDAAYPQTNPECQHLLRAAKALIVHAKGRATAAGAYLDGISDERNPVVQFARLQNQHVHRFALNYASSYSAYKNKQ